MSGQTASIRTIALIGMDGHIVNVETSVANGVVSFTLVGLPDASLRESKDRVRSALSACGLGLPNQRVTVNLSPAGLPKSGSGFDLAIALSVLLASGQIPPDAVVDTLFLGELGLDGSLRPPPGLLAAVIGAARGGTTDIVVPAASVAQAALVPGVSVHGYEHLADLVESVGGIAQRSGSVGFSHPSEGECDHYTSSAQCPSLLDLSDVRGQSYARTGLEIAAAGGHHIMLIGEPGAGKTMLARALPTILPPLDTDTSLTTTALHCLAQAWSAEDGLITQPPIEAPHHSASMPALVGGGQSVGRPGAISLAHGGVLFLDEAAEFAPSVMDALREPLENGVMTIHRSRATVTFPASFQLVLATNPCPCGNRNSKHARCTCTSMQQRRYLSRLSGPLLDRVDIQLNVSRPTAGDFAMDTGETSACVRERVEEARQRQRRRFEGTPWRLNREVPGSVLRRDFMPDEAIACAMSRAVDCGSLSMRGADKVLRVAWTIADLAGHNHPTMNDFTMAYSLRTGEDYDDPPTAR